MQKLATPPPVESKFKRLADHLIELIKNMIFNENLMIGDMLRQRDVGGILGVRRASAAEALLIVTKAIELYFIDKYINISDCYKPHPYVLLICKI